MEVEALWGAKTSTTKGDRLDVLATLIDAYEGEHYPVDPPDPIEAIKFRMGQMDLTRKDLEPLIGTHTRIAEVLNGARRLSISIILRLHEKWGGAELNAKLAEMEGEAYMVGFSRHAGKRGAESRGIAGGGL